LLQSVAVQIACRRRLQAFLKEATTGIEPV
jgi:hypothetical protein